jgi:hypothetical protein
MALTPFQLSEVSAAITMAAPTVVSLIVAATNTLNLRTKIFMATMTLHFPFSCYLHIYRAFGQDPVVRMKLYKCDVAWIHVHTLVSGLLWTWPIIHIGEPMYHTLAIIHVVTSDPTKDTCAYKAVNLISGLGVILSSGNLYYFGADVYLISMAFWLLCYALHAQRFAGVWSSSVMHLLLAVPHYCCIHALEYRQTSRL